MFVCVWILLIQGQSEKIRKERLWKRTKGREQIRRWSRESDSSLARGVRGQSRYSPVFGKDEVCYFVCELCFGGLDCPAGSRQGAGWLAGLLAGWPVVFWGFGLLRHAGSWLSVCPGCPSCRGGAKNAAPRQTTEGRDAEPLTLYRIEWYCCAIQYRGPWALTARTKSAF
jgi:hypothetical protein